MQYKESTWYGFRRIDFSFEGREALLVFPEKPRKEPRLAMKMLYFGEFVNTEVEMLKAGYHLCFVKPCDHWACDDDCHRKARFIDFLAEEFGLPRKVVAVGMSCGGFHAIMFASHHPEHLSFMYLDAPLLTFFSTRPHRLEEQKAWRLPEIQSSWGFKTYAEAYCYNGQPLHRLPEVVKHKIPLALVWGTSDEIVPPEENAEILRAIWEEAGAPIRAWERPSHGHHPHGLTDPTELLDFIEEAAL